MVRPREYKNGNLSNVPLMLDRELMDKFADILPRHKSISQAIREYMQEVIDEQKKGEALSRLPILTSDVHQTSINEYTSIYINNLMETPDEVIEQSLKSLPIGKTDLIYEKLGSMRNVLREMDYVK